MIICGTNDKSLRKHLLCESEATLLKVIFANHAAEKTRKQACENLKSKETIVLHKISKLKHSKYRSQTSTQTTDIIKKCKFCQKSHPSGKFPA